MAERYPVVLVHGYSDKGKSFAPWKAFLESKNYSAEEISICNYQSLTNEVTIKDLAEGFDRALRTKAHLGGDQPFSAIVHSTGMLDV
jgi:triacylglycerol esterase/lipase EstA (alpha/beta hydrolase family)